MPRGYMLFGAKYKGIPPSERKGLKSEDIHRPEQSAREFLEVMDDAAKDCDVSLFSLYMANVFSNAERAFNKGNITQSEMRSLKESATHKVIGFIQNCKCGKK